MRIGIALVFAIGCARPTPPPTLGNVSLAPAPTPDPPATCKPPCKATDGSYRLRMAAIECRVACLKEHVWREKSRVELLSLQP